MKQFILTALFLVIMVFVSVSLAEAGGESGIHLKSSYSQVIDRAAAAHDHSALGTVMGIELDQKSPCRSFMDCACFGCQRSHGSGTAFLPVSEAFVPATYAALTRILTIEGISIFSAGFYVNLHTSLPLRPPQG